MKTKTNNIIHWVLTGLVGIVFLGSGASKLIGSEDSLKMAQGFGLSASNFTMLGIIEILSVLLFIYPRTGVLGTLLLAAYMGGAVATHLEHGQSVLAPVIISAFVWIVAVLRFSELRNRIQNN